MEHLSQHFSDQRWVDFARGVGTIDANNRIKAHLAVECGECKISQKRWREVARLAAAEATYDPPDNLVHLVKVGFSHKATPEPQKWTLANLIFDSFAQPLPAGIRSGASNASAPGVGGVRVWQMVHEAEGLTVDLRFSHRTQSKAVQLVGQVFDKHATRPLQQSAFVELSTDEGQVVAATVVSPLGEFHIEFAATNQLILSVKAFERNTVRIQLVNVSLK
jgi:hypothetical protein